MKAFLRYLNIMAGVFSLSLTICAFAYSPRGAFEIFIAALTLWIWLRIPEEEAL